MSRPGNADAWLEAHPYLQPLARVCARVEEAAAAIEAPRLEPPVFDDHRSGFLAGVPLLQGSRTVDFEPAGAMAVALLRGLASDPEPPPPGPLEEVKTLDEQLRREPEAARRVADWLLGDDSWPPPVPRADSFSPSAAGLLRYLGWTAAARYLAPLVSAFEGWRGEGADERWLRRYCPLCGSLPAMAQLVGVDPGRKRLLVCGGCRSRWQFKRTGCPFCEVDAPKIAVVAIEGESGLRVDYCESCRGYVKTYDGQGREDLLLADWTSLHVDVIAHDRGLKRLAASLFALDPGPSPEPAVPSRGLSLPVLR